ncbi:MAG: sulfate ABC transporter permease subunit CysT [Archangiaceae bacterium]|nr:sulfate ABC transporter permease subunit CysT [Archangiaceae bacterium]
MRRRVLPGFGLSLGITGVALALVVVVPLSGLLVKTATLSPAQLWESVTTPSTLAAYRLSFGASFASALVNAVAGLLVAWVLVRYRFPGRSLVDALVDLPFALPTAVAGLTLAALYGPTGPFGRLLAPLGVKVAFTPLGVALALSFVGLPFVVRTVQPVLEQLDPSVEEAAAVLGATRLQTFTRVIFPAIAPAVLTGATLSFARALGEYGSIVFISGNLPGRTEIIPLLIAKRLEADDDAGATALAIVMLAISFSMLLVVNVLQRKGRARHA